MGRCGSRRVDAEFSPQCPYVFNLPPLLRYDCLEIIKYTQLEKYNGASTQEEKDAIEINPYKIIYGAMENAKPLLKIADMRKGAVMYRVPVPGESSESSAPRMTVNLIQPFAAPSLFLFPFLPPFSIRNGAILHGSQVVYRGWTHQRLIRRLEHSSETGH